MTMEPRRLSQPPHHHHHHHHHHDVTFCPHQHHCHHHHHHMVLCPNHHHHHLLLSSSFSQNPDARGAVPADNQFESDPADVIGEVHPLGKLHEDGDDVVEVEEEDPIFVLTEEWREYFAKSEAKRRLAKKMAKKGRK